MPRLTRSRSCRAIALRSSSTAARGASCRRTRSRGQASDRTASSTASGRVSSRGSCGAPRRSPSRGRTLARRDRSRGELEARLEQRGVVAAVREEALDRLEELGAVDDERFASDPRGAARRAAGRATRRSGRISRAAASRSTPSARRSIASTTEAVRAQRLLAGRGASRRTLTLLARRGFDPALVGDLASSLDDAETA